jgi:hypothetical protein
VHLENCIERNKRKQDRIRYKGKTKEVLQSKVQKFQEERVRKQRASFRETTISYRCWKRRKRRRTAINVRKQKIGGSTDIAKKVKLLRAQGGCLGTRSRRRTR